MQPNCRDDVEEQGISATPRVLLGNACRTMRFALPLPILTTTGEMEEKP